MINSLLLVRYVTSDILNRTSTFKGRLVVYCRAVLIISNVMAKVKHLKLLHIFPSTHLSPFLGYVKGKRKSFMRRRKISSAILKMSIPACSSDPRHYFDHILILATCLSDLSLRED